LASAEATVNNYDFDSQGRMNAQRALAFQQGVSTELQSESIQIINNAASMLPEPKPEPIPEPEPEIIPEPEPEPERNFNAIDDLEL